MISACFPCLQINQSKLFSDWALGSFEVFYLDFGYRESSPSDTHDQARNIPLDNPSVGQEFFKSSEIWKNTFSLLMLENA